MMVQALHSHCSQWHASLVFSFCLRRAQLHLPTVAPPPEGIACPSALKVAFVLDWFKPGVMNFEGAP